MLKSFNQSTLNLECLKDTRLMESINCNSKLNSIETIIRWMRDQWINGSMDGWDDQERPIQANEEINWAQRI